MATRKSIRAPSPSEKTDFVDALFVLKHERTGTDGLTTYDGYVVTHAASMSQPSVIAADLRPTMIERFQQTLPPGNPNALFLTRRNAAHRGPAFLPWHREFLRQFEADMQRVLGNTDFGLPYWDWETDGDLPVDEQTTTDVWELLGGDGDSTAGNIVTSPPFGFDVSDTALLNDPTVFTNPRSWIIVDPAGRQNGFLRRALGRETDAAGNPIAPTLPTSAQVNDAINNISIYDDGNWDELSPESTSFRNVLEGFTGPGNIHNRIHQWVGGSMGPGTSPNDIVFFLHHCNVDRIWSLWEAAHVGWTFVPQSGGPPGHNWTDLMYPWNGAATPLSVTVETATRSDDFDYDAPP